MNQLDDLATVLDIEGTEVASDVDRRAAARAPGALFPASDGGFVHCAVDTVDKPTVWLAAAGAREAFLPDLPTSSHDRPNPLTQIRLPFARGTKRAGVHHLFDVQAIISLRSSAIKKILP